MKWRARSLGRIDIDPSKRIFLDHQTLHGVDFSGRELSYFGATGSRLENCTFENTQIESASFGAGREVSEYIECNFDGASLCLPTGGFSRFVGCSFRDTELRDWFCFAVELIDCTFSGAIRKAIFNGTVPKDLRKLMKRKRERNEFHGNDFAKADLIDVAFRTGIDLDQQRLPSGADYLYLRDARSALSRARDAVTGWTNQELQRHALVLVDILTETVDHGQRQLLLRPADFTTPPQEAIVGVFALLRESAQS